MSPYGIIAIAVAGLGMAFIGSFYPAYDIASEFVRSFLPSVYLVIVLVFIGFSYWAFRKDKIIRDGGYAEWCGYDPQRQKQTREKLTSGWEWNHGKTMIHGPAKSSFLVELYLDHHGYDIERKDVRLSRCIIWVKKQSSQAKVTR